MSGKACRRCGEVREAAQFPPNPRMRDGLHSWCRVCMAGASRRWRDANPDRVEAYNLSRRAPVSPTFTERDRQRLRDQARQARERSDRLLSQER